MLGTSVLHRHRVRSLGATVATAASRAWEPSKPIQPVPAEITGYAKYLPSIDQVLRRGAEVDRGFMQECLRCLCAVVVPLRRRRDPHSERWGNMLPVFLCGGGSRMHFYQQLVTELDDWIKRHFHESRGLKLIQLPKPGNLEAEVDDAEYHRLSVAWGLSHPDIDIGPIIPGRLIEDVPSRPKAPDFKDRFVSKEMV